MRASTAVTVGVGATAAVLVHGAFYLIGRGRGPPEKAGWKPAWGRRAIA